MLFGSQLGRRMDRLGQLAYALVAWWNGGSSLLSDIKTLRRRTWSSWAVKGFLDVVEMVEGYRCLNLKFLWK